MGGEIPSKKNAAAPLSDVVRVSVAAMLSFLTKAVASHPDLCYEPLRLIGEMLGGYNPQVGTVHGCWCCAGGRACRLVLCATCGT